jgi:translation initiation factor IF-2
VAVRIYALAKQLQVDSKVLVDVCNKAGITGKGSALASLTDEEEAKVREFYERSKRPAARAAAGTARPAAPQGPVRREDYIGPGGAAPGKVPVLPTKAKKKGPAPAIQEEETQVAREEPPQELPQKPAKEERPREERPKEQPDKEKDRQKKEEKGAPAIKLAPMPSAHRGSEKPAPKEPAPQKPDIKLPPDAIRAGKGGATPLKEHLRKHEEKKKKAEAKKEGPRRPAAAEATPQAPSPARDRVRRARGGAVAKEPDASVLGGREVRQLRRKRAATVRHRKSDEDESPIPKRRRTRIKRTGANTAAPRKTKVVVQFPCTVRSFSEAIGVPAQQILSQLLKLGTMSSITANLDRDTAEFLAAELGVEVDFREELALEAKVLSQLEVEDPAESLTLRPPVVTFLGHVDHGKTSLLDKIIGIDVVSGETGGITQHIRAYRIERDGRPIAFVDTPGHEAFTAMRARGANVTDIAVLVVAADDGVMPQTEEAISHARAAGVPIVVALNKIDLPGVSPQRAYEQLAAAELLPTEWGGDTEVIKTSAVTGEGIDELLETLLTVAELHEYKARADRAAVGTCLEAELDENRGVVAKLLVQRGTLHVGDVLVCGTAYGRIKAMYDTLNDGEQHETADPSTPVNVTGLGSAPGAGDSFYVLDDISEARELAQQRTAESRHRELTGVTPHVTLENLLDRLGEQETKTLNIILRADVRGSIEAIRKELTKLDHPEVQIRVLQATVGGVTEADVHLADASDAVIIGFGVVPDEGARQLADRLGVQIRRYDIIYQVTDDLRAALEGMLEPEQRERDLGRALVQRTFHISRLGTVAGCRVLAGTIQRDARIRVIRESRIVGDYPLDSLKREKDDAREVREGYECGIKLAGFNDVKEGDVLEAYKVEKVRRTFEDDPAGRTAVSV